MRIAISVLALAMLSGCSASQAEDEPRENQSQVTFDGADFAKGGDSKLAHGERLSYVLGCRACHTEGLTGQPFPPRADPPSGIHASNVTQAMQRLSDVEFDAILRTGKHPDGRDLYYMPSQNYRHLSSRDMEALIAHLRQVEPAGDDIISQPNESFLTSREDEDAIQTAEQMVAISKGSEPPSLGDAVAQGRYIAMTSCAECHAADLNGYPGFTPPLTASSTYDDDQLHALLTTGESFDGREIGLMGFIGGFAYSKLTDEERDGLIAYLRAWTEWKMDQSE